MPDNQINYMFHIPFVIILLLFQAFTVDIYAYFHSKNILSKYSDLKNKNESFYKSGEYIPLNSREEPDNYKYVLVKTDGTQTIEIYFTDKGVEITLTYIQGKWRSTSYNDGAGDFFSILPMCGFLLFMFSVIHKVFRTGAFFTWNLARYSFDKTEKISLIYGAPLFISFIVYGLSGLGP